MLIQTLLTIGIASAAAVSKPGNATKWLPSAQASQKWQIILSSTLDINSPLRPSSAEIWDLDLFETSEDTISELKSMGKTVICYFSAGTSEPDRPDLGSLSSSDRGAKLPDWPGENWLNLKSDNVFNIMSKRIALAAQKGCDAVDPDNMGTAISR
jgi:hypothetical protein